MNDAVLLFLDIRKRNYQKQIVLAQVSLCKQRRLTWVDTFWGYINPPFQNGLLIKKKKSLHTFSPFSQQVVFI